MAEVKTPLLDVLPKIMTTEPPVDMDRVLDLTDGNHESLRELIELYLKQTNQQFEQMQSAILTANADALRRVAHSCAGSSATLGMTRLVPHLRELEKLGASGTFVGTHEICEAAAREYECVQVFLKSRPELTSLFENLIPA